MTEGQVDAGIALIGMLLSAKIGENKLPLAKYLNKKTKNHTPFVKGTLLMGVAEIVSGMSGIKEVMKDQKLIDEFLKDESYIEQIDKLYDLCVALGNMMKI